MAPNYCIDLSNIEHLILDYSKQHSEYKFTIARNDDDIVQIKINKPGDKKASILNLYKKAGGQVSMLLQGTTAYHPECLQCFEHIKSESSYDDVDMKYIAIDDVNQSDFQASIDSLSDSGYKVEEKKINDPSIIKSFKIFGKNKDNITVHFYKNNKVYVQGRTSPIFIFFMLHVVPLLDGGKLEELLSLGNVKHNFIDENISKHIPIRIDKIGVKGKTLIKSSLLSINRPILMPDYSMYVGPLFRVLEALLKDRVSCEIGPFSNFNDFFDYKRQLDKHEIKNELRSSFTKNECESIEEAYSLLTKHRNPLSHGAHPIDSTRILTLEECIDLSKECLKSIKNLCENCNWN